MSTFQPYVEKEDYLQYSVLARVNDGTLTVTDIEYINVTCYAKYCRYSTVMPPNIQYCTYYNRDRDSINTGLFDDYCRRTGGNNARLYVTN
jgi:hypothetical protein